MKQNEEIPASVRCIIPFAGWLEKHPMVFRLILIIESLALIWAVTTYEFTTK